MKSTYDPILGKLRKEDEQSVTGLYPGEKILELVNGKLKASISIAIEPGSGAYAGKTTIVLYGKPDGTSGNLMELCRIDASRFVNSEILKEVTIETDPQGLPEGTYIKFVWNFTPEEPGQNITWLNVTSILDDLNTTYELDTPKGAIENNVYLQLTGSDGTVKKIYLKSTTGNSEDKASIFVKTNAAGDIVFDTNATADSALSEEDIEEAIKIAEALGPLD